MRSPPSRFAECPRWAARILLALLFLISAYGATLSVQPRGSSDPAVVDLTDTDLALYKAIAGRVSTGESYYEAAVAEQRARGYPLRPSFTVRLPTLAWTIGAVGAPATSLILKLLTFAALFAFAMRMRQVSGSRAAWAGAAFLATCGMVLLTVPAMTFWHESWAVLLIILSLALRSEKMWIPSVILGVLAVLFRELALPYLAVMTLFAWRERCRTEAIAWAAASIASVVTMIGHASILSLYVTSTDPVSPGWSGAGGWPFVLGMMQLCSTFLFLPLWAIGVLVPLALLGWASLRNGMAERISLLLLGYVVAFMLLGRPDNFYWGLLIAPLLPVGLAFAPGALRDLFGNLQFLNRTDRRLTG